MAKIVLTDLELDKIRREEYNFLLSSMMLQLAKREMSPRKLINWLNKRKLNENIISEFFEIAKEENFLNPERFIKYWSEKRFLEGKKPWWVVKKEIESEIFLGYETPQQIKSLKLSIEKMAYDDLKILMKNNKLLHITHSALKSNSHKIKKIKNKLLYKGFSSSIINKWLNKLKENNE